jgi:hypothetical protein
MLPGNRVIVTGPEGSSQIGEQGTIVATKTAAELYPQYCSAVTVKTGRHKGRILNPPKYSGSETFVQVLLDSVRDHVDERGRPRHAQPPCENFPAAHLELVDGK